MSQGNNSGPERVGSITPSDFQAPSKKDNFSVEKPQPFQRDGLALTVDGPWWHSQFNLMLLVFGLMAFAAFIFVLLAPEPNQASINTRIDNAGTAQQAPVVQTQEDEVAPFDEAQREQARADSQDILSGLLDSQKKLKQMNVDDWASDEYQAALKVGADGDEFYKQQDYRQAIEAYQLSAEMLAKIDERIPEQIKKRVKLGNAALNDGKSELARNYFQSALELDQNHIPALQGIERVKTLDQVLELLSLALDFEQRFLQSDDLSDLAESKANFQAAVDLDSRVDGGKEGLARTEDLEVDKLYRDAMSEGFSNLFANRYQNARSGFNAALKLRPQDQVAKSALRQSLASDKRTSLKSLLSSARQFEAKEQWANALSTYRAVLQRDRNQVSAKVGEVRTRVRSDLDQSIKAVLSDPLSLSKASPNAKANALLKDAQLLKNKGPLLDEQIAKLRQALDASNRTVKVAIDSDSLTQISIKKEGAKRISLGRFDSKKMALQPGRYVLTGTRLGFRDVREEVEILPGTTGILSFNIECDQALAGTG